MKSARAQIHALSTPQLVTAQMKLEARAHKDHDAAIALRLVRDILTARYGEKPALPFLPNQL